MKLLAKVKDLIFKRMFCSRDELGATSIYELTLDLPF